MKQIFVCVLAGMGVSVGCIITEQIFYNVICNPVKRAEIKRKLSIKNKTES